MGSSPHVRGAPESPRTCEYQARDHPRMCGEHGGAIQCRSGDAGIIPACAGSTQLGAASKHAGKGSSPHVRGAPAGTAPSTSSTGDHPRMCGEHKAEWSQKGSGEGSSPHVRGARQSVGKLSVSHGIIPACAGSTLRHVEVPDAARDHPRMCGEHPRPARRPPQSRGIIPACAGSTGPDV